VLPLYLWFVAVACSLCLLFVVCCLLTVVLVAVAAAAAVDVLVIDMCCRFVL
jgi:hypothetical protein